MASVLSTPTVSLVSLVKHAANGMPFTILKSEDGLANTQPQTENIVKSNIPSFGSAGSQLNRLEFAIDLFKTEQMVNDYLAESSITGGRITKTETHFIVQAVHADSFQADSIEAVKGDKDGVTYFIGKLKAPVAAKITPPTASDAAVAKVPIVKSETGRVRGDEEEEEETAEATAETLTTEEVAPLTEVVEKMDSWIARQTGTQTIDETMATGEPELPGYYTISDALRATVMNIVKKAPAEKVAPRIQAAYARAGEITVALAGLFSTIQKSDTETVTILNRVSAVKALGSPAAPSGKAGVVKKSDSASEGGDETGKKKEGEEEEEVQDPVAKSVTDAVKAAIAPLSQQVANLSAQVEEVQKSASAVEGIEGRLVSLEEVRQVRKSLPSDGGSTVEKSEVDKEAEIKKADREKKQQEETAKDAAFKEKQRKNRLGIV